MSLTEGRQMAAERHHKPTTVKQSPIDIEAIRRSGITRGRAMYQAARGDRAARRALDILAAEQTDPPPQPAA